MRFECGKPRETHTDKRDCPRRDTAARASPSPPLAISGRRLSAGPRGQANGGKGKTGLSLSEGIPLCYSGAAFLVKGVFQTPPHEVLRYLAGQDGITQMCERSAGRKATSERLLISARNLGIADFSAVDELEGEEFLVPACPPKSTTREMWGPKKSGSTMARPASSRRADGTDVCLNPRLGTPSRHLFWVYVCAIIVGEVSASSCHADGADLCPHPRLEITFYKLLFYPDLWKAKQNTSAHAKTTCAKHDVGASSLLTRHKFDTHSRPMRLKAVAKPRDLTRLRTFDTIQRLGSTFCHTEVLQRRLHPAQCLDHLRRRLHPTTAATSCATVARPSGEAKFNNAVKGISE